MKKRTLFPGRREIRTIAGFENLFLKKKLFHTLSKMDKPDAHIERNRQSSLGTLS